MQTPSEHAEQVAVCKWLRARDIDFFAVPNGAKCGPKQGSKLKKEGLTPGVADLIITTPPCVPGIALVGLEMKRRGAKGLSATQKAWHALYGEKRAWLCLVAFGAQDAIGQLQKMGYGR